jgi:hypothetical protein
MEKKLVIHSAVKGGTKSTKEIKKVVDKYFAEKISVKKTTTKS